ncbi:MAG: DMT family transporter [Propionibacterium sp.]
MSRTTAIVSLVAATAFWSGNYIFGKVAVAAMSPFSLVFLRWAIALIPLVILAQVVERPDWRALMRHWKFLLLQSALGMFAYNVLLYAALQVSTPFAASLINAANPALIAVAAFVVLGERIGPRGIVGIVLALLGVLIVLTHGDIAALFANSFGTGDLLMLAVIAVWTAYTIAARRGPQLPPISQVAVQTVFIVVGLGLAAPFVGVSLPHSSPALLSLLFIAVFPSFASYVLWNRALETIPPARAGVFLNLITLFTASWALLTGTPITAPQIIGGIAIIIGVLLTALPASALGKISLRQDERRDASHE